MTWMDVAQGLVFVGGGALIFVTALLIFVMMTDRMDRK